MKHVISVRWLVNPNRAICPMIYGARISVIDVKILKLIEWSHSFPPPIMWRLILKWLEQKVRSCFNPFMVFVFKSTPNHIPLKNRCPYYCYVRIKDIYLIQSEGMDCDLAFFLDWKLPMVGIFVGIVWEA